MILVLTRCSCPLLGVSGAVTEPVSSYINTLKEVPSVDVTVVGKSSDGLTLSCRMKTEGVDVNDAVKRLMTGNTTHGTNTASFWLYSMQ